MKNFNIFFNLNYDYKLYNTSLSVLKNWIVIKTWTLSVDHILKIQVLIHLN